MTPQTQTQSMEKGGISAKNFPSVSDSFCFICFVHITHNMPCKTAEEHKAEMEHILSELFEVDDDVEHDDCPLRDALIRKWIHKAHILVMQPMEDFSKWQADCPNNDGTEKLMRLFPDHCQPLESFKHWTHHLECKGQPVDGKWQELANNDF